jgi:hypothetical protein
MTIKWLSAPPPSSGTHSNAIEPFPTVSPMSGTLVFYAAAWRQRDGGGGGSAVVAALTAAPWRQRGSSVAVAAAVAAARRPPVRKCHLVIEPPQKDIIIVSIHPN